jgi:hypothetical protein
MPEKRKRSATMDLDDESPIASGRNAGMANRDHSVVTVETGTTNKKAVANGKTSVANQVIANEEVPANEEEAVANLQAAIDRIDCKFRPFFSVRFRSFLTSTTKVAQLGDPTQYTVLEGLLKAFENLTGFLDRDILDATAKQYPKLFASKAKRWPEFTNGGLERVKKSKKKSCHYVSIGVHTEGIRPRELSTNGKPTILETAEVQKRRRDLDKDFPDSGNDDSNDAHACRAKPLFKVTYIGSTLEIRLETCKFHDSPQTNPFLSFTGARAFSAYFPQD